MINRHVLPLAGTSLVFFLFLIIMVFRSPGAALKTIVPLIVAGISFCGSLLAVIRLKAVSNHWYWGIFHLAGTGIVCIAAIGMLSSWARNMEFLELSLAFLSLTSTGFFIAFPQPQRKITRYFALVSGVISIYAVFLIWQLVSAFLHPLQTSWSVLIVYSAFYLILLLPLVGLCHIGAALTESPSK
ncbi:MAG: hypothetical protein WC586_04760 [Methanoregula sp.]